MKPLDWRGILERAGADQYAPEGSQGHSLFRLSAAIGELVEATVQRRAAVNYYQLKVAYDREGGALAAFDSGATP